MNEINKQLNTILSKRLNNINTSNPDFDKVKKNFDKKPHNEKIKK